MEQTERDALRKLAEAWRDYKLNNVSNTAEHIGMLFVHKRNFEKAVTPAKVIELLDAMDAQARRIAELDARDDAWRVAGTQQLQMVNQLSDENDALRAELDALRGQGACGYDETTGNCTQERCCKVAKSEGGGFAKALDIRVGQGWKLPGDKIPVLYTDTINGQQVMRDDVWLCTTAALVAPAQPTITKDKEILEHALKFVKWQLCEAVAPAQPAQGVNAELVEALKDTLYSLQVPNVSCQKGVIALCKCRKCIIDRADNALADAKAAQQKGGE